MSDLTQEERRQISGFCLLAANLCFTIALAYAYGVVIGLITLGSSLTFWSWVFVRAK